MTVLLLHNDLWERKQIRRVLRTAGYSVTATDDIELAIAVIDDDHEFVALVIAPEHEYNRRLKAHMEVHRKDVHTVVTEPFSEIATAFSLRVLVNATIALA
jgi:hypothetical protein